MQIIENRHERLNMPEEALSLDVAIHQEGEKYGKRRMRRESLEGVPILLPFLFESRGVLDKSIFILSPRHNI